MFNGLFNEHPGMEKEKDCGGCFGFGNCTWILLIILFVCCCGGGKMGNFNLSINPLCLLLVLALLCCCGCLKIGKDCR